MPMQNPKSLIPYLDLTTLNLDDTDATIIKLCQKAATPYGHVAAVCLYGQFIPLAKEYLHNTPVQIATVANFPEGSGSMTEILKEIERYLQLGADEIDVVIDYQRILQGNQSFITPFVKDCKSLCQQHLLKVILETGELKDTGLIDYASRAALDGGADFLKTSTGKVSVNATQHAATIMLNAIKEINPDAGFKAAGGIKTPESACEYLTLASNILGEAWLTPRHFRIGASSLLDMILGSVDHWFTQ
jgi:deoxyribose-phosphate aldolase